MSNTVTMSETAAVYPKEQISRETIKQLCKNVGIREGARQLGLPEARLLQWSHRDPEGPWKPLASKPGPKPVINPTSTPSQAFDNHLLTAKNKSKSLLAKFVVNASKVAARSRSPLSDATKVKDVAAVYDKVWPGEKESTGTQLNVLNIGGSMSINEKGLG